MQEYVSSYLVLKFIQVCLFILGLDKFGNVYEDVDWESGVYGVYFHKLCITNFFNARKLEQAKNRLQKLNIQKEAANVEQQELASTSAQDKRSSRKSGLVYDKLLCMKPENKKHPNRSSSNLILIQQLKAWHTFKSHTVFLKDESMRDRLLGLISSINDPFATEIRYHKACWDKYVYPVYNKDSEISVHLQKVRTAEVNELFLHHVKIVIIDQSEPRTLQGLLLDYQNMLKNFGYDSDVIKSAK